MRALRQSEGVLSTEEIARLVAPYLERVPSGALVDAGLYERLRTYLELLLRWNARTNLTAVRDPEEMVRRHFGESLFAGCVLGECVGAGAEVLDLGSGAGFPGVPVQLLLPSVQVTLAESQGKKVAFLREAVRGLGLGCEVWAGRVEAMPAARRF
jgi:16S rRNA (guanine527-N7)-methyltransferase